MTRMTPDRHAAPSTAQSTAAPSSSPADRSDRHAVIGAGFCGLGVAAALKRNGIAYDQFEADDDIGGNWYHGVYENVHIISSRKTTQYSDWPMPEDWPDFPSAKQMLTYLRGYADHWQLRPSIEFETRVEHVRPVAGDRWELRLSSGETRIYGGVVVCNGHHWDRRMPEYPGHFSGQIIHSKDYKKPDILRGKRVLVIGGGNSACDIAVEAARFADSSHISMRRGYWFMPKIMFGVPTVELLKPWMNIHMQRAFIKGILRTIVGPYENYGLEHPDHKIFERHPTINTELLHFLRHGR
ncbi:MAG: NAD(P)-binding domain-containing protein, partial [Myxococcota bacterium]